MRTKITDREIWLTGRQLVDEGSGVVDALVAGHRSDDVETVKFAVIIKQVGLQMDAG